MEAASGGIHSSWCECRNLVFLCASPDLHVALAADEQNYGVYIVGIHAGSIANRLYRPCSHRYCLDTSLSALLNE